MRKSEIANLAGLCGIRMVDGDVELLRGNTAFQRQEQGLFDVLDALYEEIVKGGKTPLETEFLRGQIWTLRFILGLPALLQEEASSFKTTPPKYEPEDLAEMDRFVQDRYHETTGD